MGAVLIQTTGNHKEKLEGLYMKQLLYDFPEASKLASPSPTFPLPSLQACPHLSVPLHLLKTKDLQGYNPCCPLYSCEVPPFLWLGERIFPPFHIPFSALKSHFSSF